MLPLPWTQGPDTNRPGKEAVSSLQPMDGKKGKSGRFLAGPRRAVKGLWLQKKPGDRICFMNGANGLPKKVGDRDDSNLPHALRFRR